MLRRFFVFGLRICSWNKKRLVDIIGFDIDFLRDKFPIGLDIRFLRDNSILVLSFRS